MNDALIAQAILEMTSTSLLIQTGKLLEKIGQEGTTRARELRWIVPSDEITGWFQASPQQGVRDAMRQISEQLPPLATPGQPQKQTYEVGDTVTTVVNGKPMQVVVSKVENGKIETQDKYGKPVQVDPTKLKMIQKGAPAVRPRSAMPVIPS